MSPISMKVPARPANVPPSTAAPNSSRVLNAPSMFMRVRFGPGAELSCRVRSADVLHRARRALRPLHGPLRPHADPGARRRRRVDGGHARPRRRLRARWSHRRARRPRRSGERRRDRPGAAVRRGLPRAPPRRPTSARASPRRCRGTTAAFDAALSSLVVGFMRDADPGRARDGARDAAGRHGGRVHVGPPDGGMTMLRTFWAAVRTVRPAGRRRAAPAGHRRGRHRPSA